MFAAVTLDQKLPTLLRMHEAAFHYLGGVPDEILYDNQKTVVRSLLLDGAGTDERGEVKFNPLFLDFARYWGFVPEANILGTPLVIYMSLDAPEDAWQPGQIRQRMAAYARVLLHPGDVRWRRLFTIF